MFSIFYYQTRQKVLFLAYFTNIELNLLSQGPEFSSVVLKQKIVEIEDFLDYTKQKFKSRFGNSGWCLKFQLILTVLVMCNNWLNLGLGFW